MNAKSKTIQNKLAGSTHKNTGERYTPDWFFFQENGVCREEGRRRLDQGGSGWRHHQLIHCWTPTCPWSGVPLLWLRYAYTTLCTGPPIKLNGPGSRLHLPYVGSFFSQTMFVKDSVFTTTERNLRWNSVPCWMLAKLITFSYTCDKYHHQMLCPALSGLADFQ